MRMHHLFGRLKKGAIWHHFPWQSWNKICDILEGLHGGDGVEVVKNESGHNWEINLTGDAAAGASTDTEQTESQKSIERAGDGEAPYLQLYGMDAEGDTPITVNVEKKGDGYAIRADGVVKGEEFVVRTKAGGRVKYRHIQFGDSEEAEPEKDEEEEDAPPCGNPMNENGGAGETDNPLDHDNGPNPHGDPSDADPTPEGGTDRNPLDSPGDGGYTPTCKDDEGNENAY